MIVPEFWAEARVQKRQAGKQVTVRRAGWSDESAAAAEEHANSRANEAIQRILDGETLNRRERKAPYNGADGMPIREEIVARYGDAVVTRNSYGARCLNTPNVMFADIDFQEEASFRLAAVIAGVFLTIAVAAGLFYASFLVFLGIGFLGLISTRSIAGAIHRSVTNAKGGNESMALTLINDYSAAHPTWHLRIYRTPAGYRVLVMHETFDPRGNAAAGFFTALNTDPIYAIMCKNQNCFRARVSPKPWRIGIGSHLRPTPGVWPIDPKRMPERQRWIAEYETKAGDYASCKFVKSIGSKAVNRDAEAIRRVHDEMCRSGAELAIA